MPCLANKHQKIQLLIVSIFFPEDRKIEYLLDKLGRQVEPVYLSLQLVGFHLHRMSTSIVFSLLRWIWRLRYIRQVSRKGVVRLSEAACCRSKVLCLSEPSDPVYLFEEVRVLHHRSHTIEAVLAVVVAWEGFDLTPSELARGAVLGI